MFCLGNLFLNFSCLSGYGEWDITLYEQKIEGTSKAIYKCDAWGGRDSHKTGYTILDTTETFDVIGVKSFHLDYLLEIPTKDFIEIANVDDLPYAEMKKMVEVYTPVRLKEREISGIKMKTKFFQEKGYRSVNYRMLQYEFSNFQESKDSIVFYDLRDVKSMVKLKPIDSIKVKKGHVIIHQKENKEIFLIVIKSLEFSGTEKDSLISKFRLDLTPKNKISSSLFSDYGVFKQKIKRNDTL